MAERIPVPKPEPPQIQVLCDCCLQDSGTCRCKLWFVTSTSIVVGVVFVIHVVGVLRLIGVIQ